MVAKLRRAVFARSRVAFPYEVSRAVNLCVLKILNPTIVVMKSAQDGA